MKLLILTLLLTFSVWAKAITPNEVYSQVMLVSQHIHFLLNHYDIKDKHKDIAKSIKQSARVKPRNVWQLTYEVMVKINMLRSKHNLPIIQPVNMAPVLNLNPDLVYEQTQRMLTEFKIFETRENIKVPPFKVKLYKNKTPLDVFNRLLVISKTLDKLNNGVVTPSYVFGEQIRLFDDISLILQKLNIKDHTIPKEKNINATPKDTFRGCMKILSKIKELQVAEGMDFVDFSEFNNKTISVSDVYTITEMAISELQTIKARLNIKDIAPAAPKYSTKTPAEVAQLVSWNFRKLQQIHSLNEGR